MMSEPESGLAGAPATAAEQRQRVAQPNRLLALLLVGGALTMLAAAFGVALLATHGL